MMNVLLPVALIGAAAFFAVRAFASGESEEEETEFPVHDVSGGWQTQVQKVVKLSDGRFWVFVDVFRDNLRVIRFRQPRDSSNKADRVFVGTGEPAGSKFVNAARKAFGV